MVRYIKYLQRVLYQAPNEGSVGAGGPRDDRVGSTEPKQKAASLLHSAIKPVPTQWKPMRAYTHIECNKKPILGRYVEASK